MSLDLSSYLGTAKSTILSSAWNGALNAIQAFVNTLAAPPTARVVYTGAGQSVSNTTATAVSFSSATWDTSSFWAGGSPTKLTAPVAGKYHVTGQLSFAANAAGTRAAVIKKNGSTVYKTARVPAIADSGKVSSVTIDALVDLALGDYIEILAYQASGGSLNVIATDTDLGGNTQLAIVRVA